MADFENKKRSKGVSNGPTDISILLKMVLDRSKIDQDMTFTTIKNGFEQIVGNLILPHVEPIKIEKNILVLKAANSAWRQELFMQKKAIIDKCNSLLGKPVVRDIRFI